MRNCIALTLVELIVTVTIISVLAALTMASMQTVRRPQQTVENVTNMIQSALNQANVGSLTINGSQTVCSLTTDTNPGPNAGFGICNDTNAVWTNINGASLPPGITLTVSGAVNNTITYILGLLPTSSLVVGNSNVNINIRFTERASCFNNVIIWPNGVVDVTVNATLANCS